MSGWLVVSPERPDDEALAVTAWIARETIARAPIAPAILAGAGAVRAAFERHLADVAGPAGLAFFGHGSEDRLFDADRPALANGPALLDRDNVGRLRGFWVHAFACWSGRQLAAHADRAGGRGCSWAISGHSRRRRWEFPPSRLPFTRPGDSHDAGVAGR